ncbi:MAG TPA: DNA primase [Bacteroidota bacterium]|nr:DNA primase [Bacteroidota bacterium]
MRISDEIIDQVRTSNDIVDVVSGYVRLKKRGKSYVGLCPFHQEKTPSFTVSAEKQMYHCFGCHKGGNVFTFVMEHDNVAFAEAVRILAARVGIVIPEGPVTEGQTEQEFIYNACRFAGQVFSENLTKTDEGRGALEYFHGRGFTDETIRTFGLGYSLQSWDNLIVRAKQEGIAAEYLQKAGLVRSREDGSPYDYFRGRAMFPIFSTTGRVIGFGARKIRDDDAVAGKYINSPETSVYNKSRVLYGLFHAKEAIRTEESALMVEGYADLISLYQAGIRNVVASSGTALTEEQLQLLARYSKTLILVYDADAAGSDATMRGVDLALEQDFDVKVVRLPEGEDPDTFVGKFGAKEFRKAVGESISFLDFKARKYFTAGAISTPEGKAEAVRSIVQSIAKMKDELKRSFYVKELSARYDIYESVLYRELERWLGQENRTRTRERLPEARETTSTAGAPAPVPEQKELPPEERDLIRLMIEGNEEIVQYITSNLDVSDYADARARAIVGIIVERRHAGTYTGAQGLVQDVADPVLKDIIMAVSFDRYELSRGWESPERDIHEGDPWQIAKDAILRIKRRALALELEENQRRLKLASQQGEDSKPYLLRHQELLHLKKELEAAAAQKQ